MRAIKDREANRESPVLIKKKPGTDTYVSILRAIQMGANHPSMIVMSTKIPWLTVMQCVRTLEQKGLITTGLDPLSAKIVSKLTELGNNALSATS